MSPSKQQQGYNKRKHHHLLLFVALSCIFRIGNASSNPIFNPHRRVDWGLLLQSSRTRITSCSSSNSLKLDELRRIGGRSSSSTLFASLRGGGAADVEVEEAEEYDDEEEEEEEEDEEYDDDEEEEEDEYDEEEEEGDEYDEEEVETTETSSSTTASVGAASDGVVVEYDEAWSVTPTMQMVTVFGCIMLSRRLNFEDPKIVRLARYAFIGYILLQQALIAYVRIKAKLENNRTPITLKNPLSGLVQSQVLSNQNDMVKNMASSFLESQTTVMEYDLKQASNMNGGLLANMVMMWFLHFKMNQVQPLIMTTVQGLVSLAFNPLCQVYILGRNLERPFKNQASNKMAEQLQAAEAAKKLKEEEEEEAAVATTTQKEVGQKDNDVAASDDEEEQEDVATSDQQQSDNEEDSEDEEAAVDDEEESEDEEEEDDDEEAEEEEESDDDDDDDDDDEEEDEDDSDDDEDEEESVAAK